MPWDAVSVGSHWAEERSERRCQEPPPAANIHVHQLPTILILLFTLRSRLVTLCFFGRTLPAFLCTYATIRLESRTDSTLCVVIETTVATTAFAYLTTGSDSHPTWNAKQSKVGLTRPSNRSLAVPNSPRQLSPREHQNKHSPERKHRGTLPRSTFFSGILVPCNGECPTYTFTTTMEM